MRSSVEFWYCLISRRATEPTLVFFFWTPVGDLGWVLEEDLGSSFCTPERDFPVVNLVLGLAREPFVS